MYDAIEFGKYLEDTRTHLGFNSTKFSKLIGVQRQTWRNWERGKGLNEDKIDKIDSKVREFLKNNPDLEVNIEHKEFGEFLHNMRKSVGWSSARMGEKLGYHGSSILRWEKGKSLSEVDIYLLEQKARQVVKEELQQRRLTLNK